MIARICSIAVFGIAVVTSNTGYSRQDDVTKQLDRVNQILSQIQNQTGAAMPTIEPSSSGIPNPFSRGVTHSPALPTPSVTASSSTTGSRAERPSVSFEPEMIKIEVGGQAFAIPRTASQGGVDPGGSSARNAARVAGDVVGDARGGGLKNAMAYEKFASSLVEFKRGKFAESEMLMSEAVGDLGPNDPVLQHHSMVLFQNGKFNQSSAYAYDALRSSEPFGWDEIQALYGDSQSYTSAYKNLQAAAQADPDQIELRFLLGYHHLMLGHNRHAVDEFSVVQARLKNDPVVAALMRTALVTPTPPPAPVDY